MSVRAYRVKKIDSAESDTFNLWHDEKLVAFLHILDEGRGLNSDCCGLVEIPVSDLKNAAEKADELNLDEETVKRLNEDIKIAEEMREDYLTYYCF